MVLLSLLACARCPTFAEMAVEDPDGVATDDMLTEITTAVTDFAAWTGREGACVPSVEVRADVPEQEPDSDVVGLYQGDHHPILVQADSTLSKHDIVVHELCHAVDYHEELQESWPDGAFPAESVPEDRDYPTEADRAHEAFARACDNGPLDIVAAAALDDACGNAELDEGQAYMQATVYSEFSTTKLDPAPFTVTVDARPTLIGSEYDIHSATGFAGEALLLTDWYPSDTDGARAVILRVDPSTGAVLGRIELPVIGPHSTGVVMANSDGDPVAIVESFGGSEVVSEAFRIDPQLGTATNLGLPGLPKSSMAAAVLDGRLYVADAETAGLFAWDLLTGDKVDMHGSTAIFSLQPTAGGLFVYGWDGLHSLSASGVWAELGTRPSYVMGSLGLADGKQLWLGGYDATPMLLDTPSGSWRLPENPCDTAPIVFGGPWAMFRVDDQPFVLGSSEEDGTGVPVLYALDVDASGG